MLVERDLIAGTPIVVVSSERRRTQIDNLLQIGVRAFISKPLRPERLRSALLEVLRGGGSDEKRQA